MIWLSWRQQRAQVLTIAALLALFALFVCFARYQTAEMVRQHDDGALHFGWYEKIFPLVNSGLVAIPVLAGAFVGAPLFARERERRTHLLALTQSVSRTRWLAWKLTVAVVPSVTAAALAQLLYHWWISGMRPLEPREFTTDARVFLDASGPLIVATTLFAVVLGAALGLLLGNTMSAVVTTFGVVLGLSVADRTFLRDNVGRIEGWGGGEWVTLWPSAWAEAGTLVAATAATLTFMVWWLRSRLVARSS